MNTLDFLHYQIRDQIKMNFIKEQDLPKAFVYIYKITNKINGKCYIGKTHKYERRIASYIFWYMNNNRYYKILRNMIDDGIENYQIEVIDTADDDESGVAKEKYYIDKYNSVENGYNMVNESTYHKTSTRHGNYGKLHTPSTKMKKSILICAVHLEKKRAYFCAGMKLFGDVINRPKDDVGSASREFRPIENYYIIRLKNLNEYVEKVRCEKLKCANPKMQKRFEGFLLASDITENILTNTHKYDDYETKFIYQTEDGYTDTDDLEFVRECYRMMKVRWIKQQ